MVSVSVPSMSLLAFIYTFFLNSKDLPWNIVFFVSFVYRSTLKLSKVVCSTKLETTSFFNILKHRSPRQICVGWQKSSGYERVLLYTSMKFSRIRKNYNKVEQLHNFAACFEYFRRIDLLI